jgi:hypothetical protein
MTWHYFKKSEKWDEQSTRGLQFLKFTQEEIENLNIPKGITKTDQ